MNKNKLKKVKDILLKEKARLESELSSIGKKKEKFDDDFDSRFPNWGDDVDSNAAEVNTYSSRLGVERNLERMLRAVNTALEKIEDGTYGLCAQCGNKINDARLQVFPAATHCMKCQDE